MTPQSSTSPARSRRIFMMDLLAVVPYYTAYLSRALLDAGASLTVGSITYYLDPGCFSSRRIHNTPGALDLVGRFALPRLPRRLLKLAESLVNLSALTLRFAFSRPDIVHVQYLPMLHWPVPLDLWFLTYCKRRGARIVLTVHDLLPHDSADTYQAEFHNLYHFVDHIICHSASVQARLIHEFQVNPSRISVIPHGPFFWDVPAKEPTAILDRFGVTPNVPLVLWQGLVFPYKGVDLLLEAWRDVEKVNTSAYLVVAGTGDAAVLSALREQAHTLQLKRVRLHQQFITTAELVALYQAADVVVYPYRAITTSGALATGLAFGKTILATDLPVFKELLVDGVSASLVPPETPGLSQALVHLLAEPQVRHRLSAEVKALNFGDAAWHTIAEQTLAVYDQVIAAPSK